MKGFAPALLTQRLNRVAVSSSSVVLSALAGLEVGHVLSPFARKVEAGRGRLSDPSEFYSGVLVSLGAARLETGGANPILLQGCRSFRRTLSAVSTECTARM